MESDMEATGGGGLGGFFARIIIAALFGIFIALCFVLLAGCATTEHAGDVIDALRDALGERVGQETGPVAEEQVARGRELLWVAPTGKRIAIHDCGYSTWGANGIRLAIDGLTDWFADQSVPEKVAESMRDATIAKIETTVVSWLDERTEPHWQGFRGTYADDGTPARVPNQVDYAVTLSNGGRLWLHYYADPDCITPGFVFMRCAGHDRACPSANGGPLTQHNGKRLWIRPEGDLLR